MSKQMSLFLAKNKNVSKFYIDGILVPFIKTLAIIIDDNNNANVVVHLYNPKNYDSINPEDIELYDNCVKILSEQENVKVVIEKLRD